MSGTAAMNGRVCKVYVAVTARFSPDGVTLPVNIEWEDGRRYSIDRVEGMCKAASLKAGGAGMRYTVRIGSRHTYLFREEDRWFVERR